MKNFGILLAIIGIIMLVIPGFNYVTQKKVVDIGNIKINKDENHSVEWSPIIGGILLVGGVVIFATNKSK
jgi:drug/metabolite transporter (DMT)-like permease